MQYVLFHVLGREVPSLKLLCCCETATLWSLRFISIFNKSIPHLRKMRLLSITDFNSVSSVYRNNHCLLWESCKTYKYNAWEECGFLNVGKVVHIVITVFWRVSHEAHLFWCVYLQFLYVWNESLFYQVSGWKDLHLRVFLCEKNCQQDDTGSNNASNVPSQSNVHRLRQQLQMLRIAATIQEVCLFISRGTVSFTLTLSRN